MPDFHRPTAAVALILALASAAPAAEVELGAPFGDHMVVQRDRPLRVLGRGRPRGRRRRPARPATGRRHGRARRPVGGHPGAPPGRRPAAAVGHRRRGQGRDRRRARRRRLALFRPVEHADDAQGLRRRAGRRRRRGEAHEPPPLLGRPPVEPGPGGDRRDPLAGGLAPSPPGTSRPSGSTSRPPCWPTPPSRTSPSA